MKRFCVIACHVLWRELCHFAAKSENIFQFNFLPQGLHCTPDVLRAELQKAIDTASQDGYAAILVGYGLCSNGLVGIEARKAPLVIMRGHDCITFLLGSKERYREYFDAHPGTYWYSPGWIDTSTQPGKDRYDAVLRHYVETYGEENAEYLMRMEQNWFNHYSNAAYVDLGFDMAFDYRAYTRQSAEFLNWNCDELEGDPKLLINFLKGIWNEEDFLVVQPGERIVASHDEKVITATSADSAEAA